MKKVNQMQKFLFTMSGLALVLQSCTKERPVSFKDGEGDDIFDKGVFTSAMVGVKTATRPVELTSTELLHTSGQIDRVAVESVSAPDALKPMFKDLVLSGHTASAYGIKFKVDPDFVTAYKQALSKSELSIQEAQIAESDGSSGQLLVPVFKYKVKAYGVLVRSKNDQGEDTRTLRLKPTEWSAATHLQVSTLTSDRTEVKAPEANSAEVFVRDRMDGNLGLEAEISKSLSIKLDLDLAALVYTRMNGNELAVFEITKLSTLTEELRAKVGRAGTAGQLVKCDSNILAKVSALKGTDAASAPSASECVAVLRYRIPTFSVEAHLQVGPSGLATSVVEYRDVATASSNLVLLKQNSTPARENLVGDTIVGDSPYLVRVSDVKGNEYFMRRTLQDTPNSFSMTFAGSAGRMELVRFVFDRSEVRVVRSRPTLRASGNTSTDLEVLMAFPVSYFRRLYTDSSGNQLATPNYVAAGFSESDAVAYVDWSKNTMPNLSSPISYYGLDECFDGAPVKNVIDIDKRLTEGALNFSVVSTYQRSRSRDCAGAMEEDDGGIGSAPTTNFTFKERVAFQKYDRPANEMPALNIPYEAQKRLGFGLFTGTRVEANHYGNTGTDGTEISVPSVFDIASGKKITYVLAGLPNEEPLRSRLIKATQDVIDDWNLAFKKALAGTPSERSGEVLELKVEGRDELPPRQLGDLDRNYIYYINKTTQSHVIGLGGAHANPMNGNVQAASVFIYGGNIMAAVENLKSTGRARAEYKKLTAIKPLPQTPMTIESSKPQVACSPEPEPIVEASPAPEASPIARPSPSPSLAPRVPRATREGAHGAGAGAPGPHALLRSGGDEVTLSDALQSSIARVGHESIRGIEPASSTRSAVREKLSGRLDGYQLAFQDAFDTALTEGSLQNSRRFETIYMQAQVKRMAGALAPNDLDRLKTEANRRESIGTLMSNMEKANICVFEANELASLPEGDENADDLDLVIAYYKPTLAHELGHNLGLRHNFIGSYDKANFTFDKNDKSKRDYSSIMDYLDDDHRTYDGLGPHDVAAIRAAYTGMVELAPQVVASVVSDGGKHVIKSSTGKVMSEVYGSSAVGYRYVQMADYFKAIGITSWLNLDSRAMSRLPLKKYMFCSDEDAGITPVCNRFDKGTTPLEIVNKAAEDYRTYYALRNFPNHKLRFGWSEMGGYLSGVISRLLPVRQFLDETFFQAMTNPGDQATLQGMLNGAMKGMFLFHEIVRTPEDPGYGSSDARFTEIRTQYGIVPVERKSTLNRQTDLSSERLSVRGNEYDKVIALRMLTDRRLGMSRYEQISLRVSYPVLERLMGFTFDDKQPDQYYTLGLLKEILTENLSPAVPVQGKPLLLMTGPGKLNTHITQLMSVNAIIGGLVNLDLQGLETAQNFSNLFQVLEGFQAPEKALYVMRPGDDRSSANGLRYWAGDSAKTARDMVRQTLVFQIVGSMKDTISVQFGKWLSKKTELDATLGCVSRKRIAQEMKAIEDETDKQLALIPGDPGPKHLAELAQIALQTISEAETLNRLNLAVSATDFSGRRDLMERIEAKTNELQILAKQVPLAGVILDSIPDSEVKRVPMLGQLIPSGIASGQQNIIFNNLNLMSQVLIETHPEYRR